MTTRIACAAAALAASVSAVPSTAFSQSAPQTDLNSRETLCRAVAPPAPAAAGPTSISPTRAELDCLAAEYVSLATRFAELQHTIAQLREERRPSTDGPQVQAGRDGFMLRSSDGAYKLSIRGYIHSDARFVRSTSREMDSFLLRRVRPVFAVTTFRRFELRLMPDFGEGRVVLQDAYADVTFGPALRVRTGKFKAPFGLERLASATELQFVERAMPTLLAPNRDVGVMLAGEAGGGLLSYQTALTNGVPDGSSGDSDENRGKDAVGRLVAEPFRKRGPAALRALAIAIAASVGTETGTSAIPALPVFRTAAQQPFFRYRSDGTPSGTTVADGDRLRRSVQAQWYAGRAGLLGEWTGTAEEVRRGATAEKVRLGAWLIGASLVLTGEAASPRGVTARREFDPSHHAWGAVELTVRATGLTIDDDAFPVFADPQTASRAAREWAAGANWYLTRSVKVSTSFHYTSFDGGAQGAADRPSERALLSRLQFVF